MNRDLDRAGRADALQDALEEQFGAPWPQFLHNKVPFQDGDDEVFNYWWLAHVVDARLDAYERSGDPLRLDQATQAYRNVLERNGSLFNDYFDDMLWLGLAALRLAGLSGEERYARDATAIWEHVVEFGWNDQLGPSLAWRKPQLDYKNTPANGPLAILSARLAEHGDPRTLAYAGKALDWLEATLVGPDGFVEDGINRTGDGTVDRQWRFTYNQGLYIGACLAWAQATGTEDRLEQALRTARTAVRHLTADGVFHEPVGEGGGDVGLFKGVLYRYATLLVERTGDAGLRDFLVASTDVLWRDGLGEDLLAGDDWSRPWPGSSNYSTQLSALMATESAARLAAGPGRSTPPPPAGSAVPA
ncbi:glycoside hydrolase family 76 protein [Kineococcus sp. SYSU DK003]|uniref:glycoside hydrolase family 76 protein n=1 Tax=Kineococcus sp. SYSU DK003 TaxID=3383124 RepID=UPI003D7E5440